MKAVRSPFSRRTGFSFVEHLCAIGVLSVGLLGVAGAMYAGVGQTRDTVDQATAAAVARQAVAVLGQAMTRENVQETGQIWRSIADVSPAAAAVSLRDAVAGSQIASDPRYAWTALYRRSENAATAQVTIVVLRASARAAFDARDLGPSGPGPAVSRSISGTVADPTPPTLVPAFARSVTIADNAVRLGDADADRLAPGALVVLSDTPDPADAGRVLQVGDETADGRWDLVPGQDAPNLSGSASAYVFGRGYADPADPAAGYAGANQAVAVYSAIVALR